MASAVGSAGREPRITFPEVPSRLSAGKPRSAGQDGRLFKGLAFALAVFLIEHTEALATGFWPQQRKLVLVGLELRLFDDRIVDELCLVAVAAVCVSPVDLTADVLVTDGDVGEGGGCGLPQQSRDRRLGPDKESLVRGLLLGGFAGAAPECESRKEDTDKDAH